MIEKSAVDTLKPSHIARFFEKVCYMRAVYFLWFFL